MRKPIRFIAAWVLGLAWIIPLAAQTAPDITGLWKGKVALNDGGSDAITVSLKKDGKIYAGTIVDEMGMIPEGTALKDVSLKGNAMTLDFMANGGAGAVLIKVSLTISGDTMTGRWEDEAHGEGGGVELARKK